jgi:Flp pilus assembly protein TadD
VTRNGFVNFDDEKYIVSNRWIIDGPTAENVRWAFRTGAQGNWHPVTWISHMIDCRIYGLNPAGHHLTSLLIHTANALLLFGFLEGATGALGPSFFVALLFAIHPLNVESVAWASERKNVLSTLFWLLTLWAYRTYTRAPSVARYLGMSALFALGLMTKPMVVTLPAVLLLLDYWPLRRFGHGPTWRRRLLEKAPLLVLSMASSAITYLVQHAAGATGSIPLLVRVKNAVVSGAAYLLDLAWPTRLAPFYPYPASVPVTHVFMAAVLLLGVTAVVAARARKSPYLPVGWLWYLGTLVPVIGLIQVGRQARADRYTYLPLIGVFVMIAWGVAEWGRGSRARMALSTGLATAAAVALAFQASVQVGYWRDSESLFSRALVVTRGNYVAHANVGTALAKRGELPAAVWHLSRALEIDPTYRVSYGNLAMALVDAGRPAEAISFLARFDPDDASSHTSWAAALEDVGRPREAAQHYRRAIELDPEYAAAHANFGVLLARQGRFEEALPLLRRAHGLDPRSAANRDNLCRALDDSGRREEAAACRDGMEAPATAR